MSTPVNLDPDPERFWASVEADVRACSTIEAAAQLFCERFYTEFADFAVLVRMFCTVPLHALPSAERAFALSFPVRAAEPPVFDEQTAVLTLLGTRGIEAAWCRRSESRGHLAVPLLSQEFIEGIPMISRLLGEIGFPRLSSSRAAWQFVTRDIVDVNGLFFVGDARTTTDERGRHIIPALDFVERYDIRSVFGFGGAYAATSTFLTTIIFTRRMIARPVAARFVQLIADFKACTRSSIDRGSYFNEPRR